MINMKAILLGAATAVVVVMLLLVVSMYITMEENKKVHTTNITVFEKLCGDDVLGVNVSKIKGDDGLVYFVPYADCKMYPIGMHGMIFYNHVCNLPVKEPGRLDWACFNETVGDYS